jgi:NADH:ubiquinone oxidoreductase subunit 6 (subunit J)
VSAVEIAFYLLAGLSLAAALGVVLSRNVVHAALFLMGTLLLVAIVFLFLAADFLALVQVLIYGGAVTMLMLFAIMLTRAEAPLDLVGRSWSATSGLAALAAVGFLAVLVAGVALTPWPAPAAGALTRVDVTALGAALFGPWAIPFEIASLVLLVALIGGIIIARTEEPL